MRSKCMRNIGCLRLVEVFKIQNMFWQNSEELDHLQLLLRQRRGHGVDDVEPLMLGVTEIEELAWR